MAGGPDGSPVAVLAAGGDQRRGGAGPTMLYLALARMGFRRMLAYRAATLAGLVTNFFFGALRAAVFMAVFRASDAVRIGGYSLPQAVTYTALTQALIAPLMAFGSWEVMLTIKSGDIVSDLARPVDFHAFWLWRDLGRAAFHTLTRGLPLLLAYPLFFDLVWPASPSHWLAFAASAGLAVVLSFSWRFLVNLSAFWSTDAYGLGRVAFMSTLLLSGFIVPLTFLPAAARRLLAWTPFPGLVNTPVEVFLGHHQGSALAHALLVQLAWAVALTLLARLVFRQGVRKLTAQGG